jgi:hypothetical protein
MVTRVGESVKHFLAHMQNNMGQHAKNHRSDGHTGASSAGILLTISFSTASLAGGGLTAAAEEMDRD